MPTLIGNPLRLKQVLVTLLENAIDVTKHQNLIFVKVLFDDNRLTLELNYEEGGRSIINSGYLDKIIYSDLIEKYKEELTKSQNRNSIKFSMEVQSEERDNWFYNKGMQYAAYLQQ